MIHLMIVDDEERARIGIRSLIDWESHGIQIVAEARDGAEALEIMANTHVDILLTDIRMPEVDGLELIERVNALYPHVQSVIMSGYNEFTYAQKALTLGASDYLLKPSRRQEILNTVLNLTKKIDENRRQQLYLEKLQAGFRESLPLLRDRTLSRLVLEEDPPYEKLMGKLAISDLIFPHDHYCVLIVQIDQLLHLRNQFTSFDIELFKFGLKNICEETAGLSHYGLAFEHQDDLILVLNTATELSEEECSDLARSIQQNALHFLQISVSVGIGSLDRGLTHLRNSYMTAYNALKTRYIGSGKIVRFSDQPDIGSDEEEPIYPIALEKAVLHAIVVGDQANIADNMALFRQALPPDHASKEDVLTFAFALYFSLFRLCIEKDIRASEIFGQNLEQIAERLSRSTLDGIFDELLQTAQEISRQIVEKKNSNKLFESILAYIEKNYAKEISRETVAGEAFITPGYLSRLFKQHLKMSFLDYLHQIRIERACELLADKSRRIADVALEVGYNDEKYFFQVFKKHVGMTPNQYRNG
ncbi:response regulator [Cohnella lubricantis]|uniref:Response regulator n=1 Tax=Cohnella lubricantis TaxID=2163172 RepID=A0A841TD26_9BACL|nr:response regulator [Cohnella lubricantis]MBB6677915.1 response regulator [Cohnella lubricantis]MBP2120320.1 two-component system response regulator YesN [Cohnella lubricantis]